MTQKEFSELVGYLVRAMIILAGAIVLFNMALDMPFEDIFALACGVALAADAFRK